MSTIPRPPQDDDIVIQVRMKRANFEALRKGRPESEGSFYAIYEDAPHEGQPCYYLFYTGFGPPKLFVMSIPVSLPVEFLLAY